MLGFLPVFRVGHLLLWHPTKWNKVEDTNWCWAVGHGPICSCAHQWDTPPNSGASRMAPKESSCPTCWQVKHVTNRCWCYKLWPCVQASVINNKRLPEWLSGKESACNIGHEASIPGLGIYSGEGNDNSFQYSCLANPTDRTWWATVYGVAKESDMT